jgi:hypothetical protein
MKPGKGVPWRPIFLDGFAKIRKMAKQKFRPTRLGIFSGAKAYSVYVEVLKKCRNAVGRTFCDAMAKQKFRPTRLGIFFRGEGIRSVCRGPEKMP